MLAKQGSPPQFFGAKPIDKQVRDIVARTCRLRSIRDSDSLARDLCLDGAALAELLVAIELAFRIEFSRSEATRVKTVADVIRLVRAKGSAA